MAAKQGGAEGGSVVPNASWWSDEQVMLPGGLMCPKPPPYAAAKPQLPTGLASAETPRLTAELAKKHASKDNLLIATYVNFNRLDFALTLVMHLLAMGNPHYLVGAMDDQVGHALASRGVNAFFMSTGLTTRDTGWGTPAFRQLGLHKANLVLELARTGVDCLTVDADALLLRDPFPYLRALPDADVLTSSDHLVATNGYADEGLEGRSAFGAAFNIGYIFVRATAVEFVERWSKACHRDPSAWDQNLFKSILHSGGRRGRSSAPTAAKPGNPRLQPMFTTSEGRQLMVGVLPVSLFASGHTHFVSRMAHLMQTTPYMVHTTFQYGGAQGKRHRLREGMMWEDGPEYFAKPQFLAYELDLPYSLVYPNGGKPGPDGTIPFGQRTTVEQHFALVHHQLRQLRNALALAQATGRVLILPRLVCGLDRAWMPHSGIFPGSAARLPLLDCPADHVIDLERIGRPEDLLREHSFLCNPRTPASVRGSVVRLAGTPPDLRGGDTSPAAAAAAAALVQEIRTSHAGSKVVRLAAVPDYRALLTTSREALDFERRHASWGSLWCCNRPPNGRGPGHIWYDLFADVVPHTDRHNRRWEGPWVPKMGP